MLEFGAENKEINQYSRLAPFVISIKDDPDNQLSIIIALPSPVNSQTDHEDERLNNILSDAVRIVPDESQMYEIRFDTYIIYQCRNESYAMSDPSEIIKGRHLVICERSLLLDHYKNIIFDKDCDHQKANRKHYGIYAENHTIDVISNEPPIITRLKSRDCTAGSSPGAPET